MEAASRERMDTTALARRDLAGHTVK